MSDPIACLVLALIVNAAPPSVVVAPAEDAAAQAARQVPGHPARLAIDRGLAFLRATQRPDGSWAHDNTSDPAITALAAKCFIQHPDYGGTHPVVRRALSFILSYRQPDGGIYPPGTGMWNYCTSVCLMALAAAGDPDHQPAIEAARKYLKQRQWDATEDIDEQHVWYGGAGYGKHQRPDLSNTQMMLEALKESGLVAEDPTYRKALKFIERCQMLSGANDQPFARGSDDGGFIYTAANGGESKAGTVVQDGQPRLRSYGSMTYAGFKSYLYAGLTRDDPRVQAALRWIQRHYTLDHNPNMPDRQSREGLYYYYHVFAKALQAWGEPTLVDPSGTRHDWRAELTAKLGQLQNADGSWVNPTDRWYEGNPMLVTAYAVLALQAAVD